MFSNKYRVSDCLRKDIFKAQHITTIPGGAGRACTSGMADRVNN
jgi:hypothetical protein